MSKITFRADDDLVEAVEALDASKSEVMREALRSYLESERSNRASDTRGHVAPPSGVNDPVAERVDAVLADRMAGGRDESGRAQDVNVHITVETDGTATAERRDSPGEVEPADAFGRTDACAQCGETLDHEHVYCPNCGEKATQRVFCECGDEVRADWSFCPHCGRRTTSADVLDR